MQFVENFQSQNGDHSVMYLVHSVSTDKTGTEMYLQNAHHQTCPQDLRSVLKELAVLKKQIKVLQKENRGTAVKSSDFIVITTLCSGTVVLHVL